MLPLGVTVVERGTSGWKVAGIITGPWVGERYYFLVRNSNEVAMVPAAILEEDNKELLIDPFDDNCVIPHPYNPV